MLASNMPVVYGTTCESFGVNWNTNRSGCAGQRTMVLFFEQFGRPVSLKRHMFTKLKICLLGILTKYQKSEGCTCGIFQLHWKIYFQKHVHFFKTGLQTGPERRNVNRYINVCFVCPEHRIMFLIDVLMLLIYEYQMVQQLYIFDEKSGSGQFCQNRYFHEKVARASLEVARATLYANWTRQPEKGYRFDFVRKIA